MLKIGVTFFLMIGNFLIGGISLENLDGYITGPKKKVVVNFIYGYQEKNTRAMEKEIAQSDLPVKRKIQKTIRKCYFSEIWHFRIVFWIFLFTGVTD